jgi:hypothetical protein
MPVFHAVKKFLDKDVLSAFLAVRHDDKVQGGEPTAENFRSAK